MTWLTLNAVRALALIDAVRDRRMSRIGTYVPASRRLGSAGGLPKRWDPHRAVRGSQTKFEA